ncbi:monooxygenase [Campylobacter geochelonis]|uniref:Putative monooxygenase ydhR n=1 Tax=Campylobacter geochelonis TaxID=1780362 RepID=A0A128EG66_9BACT|nr:monooxygenase [Campylobacter geochelonis]QKF71069.1 putative monooxygenase YdhR [Campylobacter geochelonis]CZE47248.1 Putative monooxygenase ydhR [Campylobacter geochelonis]CZE50115.1 Putative monooxygenase ydhR [Campylobacter geochelonis]
MVILQVDFDYKGGYDEDMFKECENLAKSIACEPGFMWKIWTQNKEKNTSGGIYAFESKDDAQKYIKMHLSRLEKSGLASNFRYEIFETNEKLSAITNFPPKS